MSAYDRNVRARTAARKLARMAYRDPAVCVTTDNTAHLWMYLAMALQTGPTGYGNPVTFLKEAQSSYRRADLDYARKIGAIE